MKSLNKNYQFSYAKNCSAGGLEQGGRVLERVSKGLGGWGMERAEGLGSGGGGWTLSGRPDGRSFVRSLARSFARSLVRTDGRKIHPSVL